jgi:tRNA (guanine-N7-)-methyltransferase
VRCRQHVNPLKKELQVPLAPPDWSAIYPDTHRPLIVDVGCGSGRFLLAISRRYQRHNLLGLDIRNKVRPSSMCSMQTSVWLFLDRQVSLHASPV